MNEDFVHQKVLKEQYLMKKNVNFSTLMKNIILWIILTYDQIEIGNDIITTHQSNFLKENEIVTIQFYDSQPVSIILPDHITLKVSEADAVVKGQTAASSYKPAILERWYKNFSSSFH